MADYDVYEIPGFKTQSGFTLDVKLAYKCLGKLSPNGDNVVLIPTFYGGRHPDTEYMYASGRAINPERHFIVLVNMHGNGF